MDSNMPPYLAQQGAMGPQNDFMGGQFANGYYNSAMGYMSGANMYGPTYGQFGYDALSTMNTPYGGSLSAGHIAPFYGSMINHPIRSFFTYTVPIFKAPKGINPIVYDNYMQETKQEAISSAGMAVVGFAAAEAGAKIGGSVAGGYGAVGGALVGTAVGIVGSKYVGAQTSRILQIHETANLLNLTHGGGRFGVGISMQDASSLNLMFAKEASKNANITQNEYQQMFSGLAQNALLDDTGDFSGVKRSLKKMKTVIVKLQDLFQNGDIKNIIGALRQLKMLNLNTSELSDLSVSAAIAGTVMGQKPRDFINNAIGEANNLTHVTGLSRGGLVRIISQLAISHDVVNKALTGLVVGGSSTKNNQEIYKNIFSNAFQEMNNQQTSSIFLSRGAFTAQQYMTTALTAGLQKYNKEHHTNKKLVDVEKNPELVKEISTKYAIPAIQEMLKKHHGDVHAVYAELAKKDQSYATSFWTPEGNSLANKYITNINTMLGGWGKMIAGDKGLKNVLSTFYPTQASNILKIYKMLQQNPELFSDQAKESEATKEKASIEEKIIEHNRNISGAGRVQKYKATALNKLPAEVAAKMVFKKTEEFENEGISQDEFIGSMKMMKKLSDINFSNKGTLPSNKKIGITNDFDVFGDGMGINESISQLKTIKGKKLEDSQTLLQMALGDSHSFSAKDIKELGVYKRAAINTFAKYNNALEEYVKTGDKDDLKFLYDENLENIKNHSTYTYVKNGILYMGMDQKEKLSNSMLVTKKISRLTLYRKALSTAKTKKEKEQISGEINQTKAELEILHKSSKIGIADLMKSLGFGTSKDELIKAQKQVKEALAGKNSKKLIDSLAKLEGVGTDVSKQQLENFVGEKKETLAAISVLTNPITTGTLNNIVKNTKTTKLAALTGKELTNFYRTTGGDVNKMVKLLGDLTNTTSKDGEPNIVNSIISGSDGTKTQVESAQKFVNTMNFAFKQTFGKTGWTYNGVTYKSFKDIVNAKDKNGKHTTLKAFLKEDGVSIAARGILGRIGVDPNNLTTKTMGALIGEKGLFTVNKQNQFVLSNYAKTHMKELEKNKDVKRLMEQAGLSTTASGFNLLQKELNGKKIPQIDRTNEILKQILNVIKTNHKSTDKSKL